MIRIFCFFALFPALLPAQSAPERDPFLVGMRAHYGFIIPHSRDIARVSGSHPFGLEFNLQWLRVRPGESRASGMLVKRGFTAHYINYDHPQVLGSCISLAAYIEPMIRADRRLYGSVQLAMGVSYITKVYDQTTNPTNLFFSTPVSFLLMANPYVHFRATPQWELSVGFNYNHISNGGMKTPNKGMNFPTWNAGLAYNFRPGPIQRAPKDQAWKNQSRYFAYVQAVGSIKTAEATDAFPENKPCWLLGGIAIGGRRIGRMSALAAGTEWVHDGWARELRDRNGDRTSALKGGILLGHELLTGRVRFTVHLGAYVYNPTGDADPVYQRYGLFYRIGRHVLFGSTLKAHRHVADVFDVRIGWLW